MALFSQSVFVQGKASLHINASQWAELQVCHISRWKRPSRAFPPVFCQSHSRWASNLHFCMTQFSSLSPRRAISGLSLGMFELRSYQTSNFSGQEWPTSSGTGQICFQAFPVRDRLTFKKLVNIHFPLSEMLSLPCCLTGGWGWGWGPVGVAFWDRQMLKWSLQIDFWLLVIKLLASNNISLATDPL